MLKVFNFSFYLVIAWLRFRKAKTIDWKKKMQEETPEWKTKRHVVFLTLYNEEWGVVRGALHSVAKAVYDKEKFIIVIAGEERREDNYKYILSAAQKEFDGDFAEIVGTLHPAGLPDEINGKGSNLNYSEREIKKYIEQPVENK